MANFVRELYKTDLLNYKTYLGLYVSLNSKTIYDLKFSYKKWNTTKYDQVKLGIIQCNKFLVIMQWLGKQNFILMSNKHIKPVKLTVKCGGSQK